MGMPDKRTLSTMAAVASLCALIFLFDLAMPLGYAGGIPYILPVVLSLRCRKRWCTPVITLACTALTVLGYFLSPPPVDRIDIPILNRAGAVLALWVTAGGIQMYRRSEGEVLQERDRVSDLLSIAEVVIVSIDPEGRVVMINNKGCELLGFEKDEVVGRNWFDHFLPPEERGKILKVFDKILAGRGKERYWGESSVLTRSGQTRLIAWQSKVLRGPDGSLAGVLSSGTDVTEWKILENNMRRKEALARLGEMAALVAHEVRNPLAGIGGSLEIIRDRLPPSSPEREVIDHIRERLDSLDGMVRDLLQFAKPRAYQFSEVDVRALVEDVVRIDGANGSLSGVRISVEGDGLRVPGDANELKGAILNLLINASQAMRGKGEVRIFVERDGRACRLVVEDSGEGVAEEIREKVFEPFFTTRARGTGLGLTMARRVFEDHGGKLKLEPSAGGGARFVGTLPSTRVVP